MKLTKENIRDFILGSTEAQEVLMVNRQRLNALVQAGKLQPGICTKFPGRVV